MRHISYYLITGSINTLNVSFSCCVFSVMKVTNGSRPFFFSVCVLWADESCQERSELQWKAVWTYGPCASEVLPVKIRLLLLLHAVHCLFVETAGMWILAFICKTSHLICVSSQHQLICMGCCGNHVGVSHGIHGWHGFPGRRNEDPSSDCQVPDRTLYLICPQIVVLLHAALLVPAWFLMHVCHFRFGILWL